MNHPIKTVEVFGLSPRRDCNISAQGKTELRAISHSIVPGATIFEVWHNGQFIAPVMGVDGPGARVISSCILLATHVLRLSLYF
jgi:hypothetical protein